ncbi:MAG: hypothetical protein IKW01_05010 [Firmicutes bacterium]|nr:hypothetical protein [Bacillota bacterium]
MADSDLKRRSAYYKKIIEEGKNSSSEKYQQLCINLEELIKLADKCGPDKKLDGGWHRSLLDSYTLVQDACNEFLGDMTGKLSSSDAARKGIVENIASVMAKDMKVLQQYNEKDPKSLQELIEKARTRTVVLKSSDFKKEGAALSTRIPMQSFFGKKGFFTPASTYNIDDKWNKIFSDYEAKFSRVSDKCKERIQLLKTNDEKKEWFSMYCPSETIEELRGRDEALAKRKVMEVAYMLGIGSSEEEIGNLLQNDKALVKDLVTFIDSMVPLANQMGIMRTAGIKKGAPISSRNCAMTDMAKLLGCGDLLAESVPMEVIIDGVPVKGVFMESVEGSDVNRLHEKDLIFEAGINSFEKSDALRQITDLQVLDFICGNTDRHLGNMIYQFEKRGGTTVLKGIKGIDNDCAFGTPKIEKDKKIMRMVNPDKMRFITESMWNRVKNTTREMIHSNLAHHGLTTEELDAACDRLQMVKDAVLKDKTLNVVPDGYWKRKSLLGYERPQTLDGINYIDGIRSIQSACSNLKMDGDKFKNKYEREYDELVDKHGEVDNKVKYVKDKITDKNVLFANRDRVKAFRKRMDDAKALFYNSEEYELMKNGYERIESLYSQLSECKEPGDIKDDIAIKLKKAYKDLAHKTNVYIELKKVIPYQTRGKVRKKLAEDLQNFTFEVLDDMTADMGEDLEAKPEEKEVNILEEGDGEIDLNKK